MWGAAAKPDPWLPPPPMSNGGGAAAAIVSSSAFPLSTEARTKSPAANSASSIEGWLQNVPAPSSNAVPVLPAKPASSELNESWSVKPDPWGGAVSKPTQQVPDPWNNSKTSGDSLDPWAPVMGGENQASGVSNPFKLFTELFLSKILL